MKNSQIVVCYICECAICNVRVLNIENLDLTVYAVRNWDIIHV